MSSILRHLRNIKKLAVSVGFKLDIQKGQRPPNAKSEAIILPQITEQISLAYKNSNEKTLIVHHSPFKATP